ncbi:MAG: DUF6057 family protein [Bacteroidaceae bacterium]
MVRYNSPHTRQVAQLMPYMCGIVFACFSFFYLYFYQADYLAQFQFHFSHGETTYESLVGAVLIILPLLVLVFFCHKVLCWPLRLCALSWFPSSFLLTTVTSFRFPELPDYDGGTPWFCLVSLFVLFVIVACLCLMHPDATGERGTFSSYLSSNLFVLLLLFFMTGALGYDSGPGHRELRVGHLLHDGRYEEAIDCCPATAASTYRLYALRTAALAIEGQLGEQFFGYPVPEGMQTLLPRQSDSLFVYDALPVLYRAMRSVPQSSDAFCERRFLENTLALDSLPRPLALDYLLCSCLLSGELHSFSQLLAQHSDSLSTSLPKHYREALTLFRHLSPHRVRSVVPSSSSKPVFVYEDEVMEESLLRFLRLHQASMQGDRQALDSLSVYAQTYWMYYMSRFR